MISIRQLLKRRSYFPLFLLFLLFSVSEKIFGSNETTNISGSFATGAGHFLILGSSSIVAAILVLRYQKLVFHPPSFYTYYIILASYAVLTSLWSPSLLKSGGLAVLDVYNLIWGVCIGGVVRRVPAEERLSAFVSIWAVFVFIDFVVENAFKGLHANLDEFSMIAFVLVIISARAKRFALAVALFLIGLSGQSFSAILGLVLFVAILLAVRKPLLSLFVSAAFFVAGQILWADIMSGKITIYGKGSQAILAGSGRFNAWNTVYQGIVNSNWNTYIFGHGYASDRSVLVASKLSWAIDVHNNLLHITYGMGIFGLALFAIAILMSLHTKLERSFSRYKLATLAAFMFFGLSSSYFFGRPSILAEFWLSYLVASRVAGKRPHLLNRAPLGVSHQAVSLAKT